MGVAHTSNGGGHRQLYSWTENKTVHLKNVNTLETDTIYLENNTLREFLYIVCIIVTKDSHFIAKEW